MKRINDLELEEFKLDKEGKSEGGRGDIDVWSETDICGGEAARLGTKMEQGEGEMVREGGQVRSWAIQVTMPELGGGEGEVSVKA